MDKEFNVTGTCIPSRHYMADISQKLEEISAMVRAGRYFVMNRPRQYGKTTVLAGLDTLLTEEGYLSLWISFEGLGDADFENERTFCQSFYALLVEKTMRKDPDLGIWLKTNGSELQSLRTLSVAVTNFALQSEKKLVLMVDEVDKSANNQLFLNFLSMLRQKFLDAVSDRDNTFHSVILAGVHDVRNLKLKLRPDEEQQYNSPWNIASEFTIEMRLLPTEILPMLEEYTKAKNVDMDAKKMAEGIFYYTSGYPFLVSKLCKLMDEHILKLKKEKALTLEDLETAVTMLIQENNPNFESLTKNIENNKELFDLVEGMVIHGFQVTNNVLDPVIHLGLMYGIFAKNGNITIHNRIYHEIITEYMTARLARQQIHARELPTAVSYVLPNGGLDMEKILLRFQMLMQEEYSRHDRDFLERNGRLVFLAFLKPILNGVGYAFKEPQISEERRLDVVITYMNFHYVVELKVWRGEKAHKAGLQQLSEYLEKQNLDQGFLLIFDNHNQKEWKKQRLRKHGKRILAVWV